LARRFSESTAEQNTRASNRGPSGVPGGRPTAVKAIVPWDHEPGGTVRRSAPNLEGRRGNTNGLIRHWSYREFFFYLGIVHRDVPIAGQHVVKMAASSIW
jgi:hypothetical protein